MRVSLRYGASELTVDVPRTRVAARLDVDSLASRRASSSSTAAWCERAFAELAAQDFEREIRDRRLAVLLSDATRSEPRGKILPHWFGKLSGARAVDLFLCTGTHDPRTADNRALLEALEGWSSALDAPSRIHLHDARKGDFTRFGTTSRGTPVEICSNLHQADVFLCLSDLKTHYFAGYSNPVKFIVPGLASFETARRNHSLALERGATFGRHPWHPDPRRRTNPVAEDMVEAFERFVGGRPHFSLCMQSGHDELLWAGGGRTPEVAGRGMRVVDETAVVTVEPARFLVVSAGGRPLDESLYTAQRALELTREGVHEGGEVCLLAECRNGIGPPSARENFFERLARPLPEVLSSFSREEYVMYSHKAWKFADYLSRLACVHLVSSLGEDEVRSIHLEPISSDPAAGLQALVDAWCARARPEDRILFCDDASKLALLAR